MQLSEESPVFARLYCADFVGNDTQSRVIELSPDTFLSFDRITGSYGESTLIIQHLQWDDILLHHDVEAISEADLHAWFQRWFDPDDARREADAEISCVIHSLLVAPHLLSVDFGTAEPEALWEMLDLLENSGASTITISSSRAEAEEAETDQ